MAPLSAAQSRVADPTSVLSTVCRSNLDRLMSLSTSAVALCCSSASSSSRRSRTTAVSWPEADELLWRTAFGAFALRLRALVGLLLAPPGGENDLQARRSACYGWQRTHQES